MKVKIAKINTIDSYDNISRIIIPATSGTIEICPDHAELFCILSKGGILLSSESDKLVSLAVEEGTAYFKDDILTVVI